MRSPANRCFAMMAILCICASFAYAQVTRGPLTDSELLALVSGNELSENIVQQVKSRGLAFRADDQYRSWMKTAGADATVMGALEDARINDSGQRAPSDPAREQLLRHLTTAGKLIRSKQYREADQELTDALQLGGAGEAGFVIGESLRQQERWPEAAAVYAELLRRVPGFIEARTKWSYVLYRQGYQDEALRQAKIVLAQAPENAEAHKNAGLALQTMQRFEAAEQEYMEALRIKPDYGAVRYDFGLLLYNEGKWDQAIAEYKKSVALDPNQGDWHNNLGLAYEANGDLSSAIREFREAKRLNPKGFEPRENLGSALMQSGMNAESVIEWHELEAMAPDSALCHKCLATALLGTFDLKGAEEEYRKAMELDPSDAYPHLGLGNVKETGKDYDGALQEFREAERLDPSDVRAHRNVGRILLGKKDVAGAFEELKRAELLGPSDGETHDLYGQALEMSADHARAIAEYKQALALYTKPDPKQAGIRLRLEAALEKNQNWAEALDQYRRAAVEDLRPDTQAQYKAAKARLDARIAAMKGSGNSTGAAELKTDVRNVTTSPRISERLDAAMLAGREASQAQRFDEAEKSYKEAVDLAEKLQPRDDRLMISLMHLGGLYQGKKDPKTESTFQRYLKASEELYGAESPQMTQALQIMGLYELANHNYDSAIDFYERAVDINQKAFGEGSQPVAMALASLATVYTEEKSYDKAESYLLRAMHIDEGLFGKDSWGVSFPLWNLCVLYDKWGKPDKAEPCYEQDLAVVEKQFGPDNPALLQVLTNEAKALRALGRPDQASKVEQRAQSIRSATPGSGTPGPSNPVPPGYYPY